MAPMLQWTDAQTHSLPHQRPLLPRKKGRSCTPHPLKDPEWEGGGLRIHQDRPALWTGEAWVGL